MGIIIYKGDDDMNRQGIYINGKQVFDSQG
ncbi:heme utilization protein, partial [Mannheimia haemolytica]